MNTAIFYLLVIHFNTFVLGYYFYNPENHQIIESSSKDFPKSYVRIKVPRYTTRNAAPLKRRFKISTGFCKDAGFQCDTLFNKTYTAIFECKNDNQCPGPYKCCDQKCFEHKICVLGGHTTPQTEDGICEKWPYNCQYPYPYAFSNKFRCDYDKQCPKNYKCCQQNCFVHKICSKIIGVGNETPKPVEEIRRAASVSTFLETPLSNTASPASLISTTSIPLTSRDSTTTTTTSSWLSIFDSNSEAEETEDEEKEEEEEEEEKEEDDDDDDEIEENPEDTNEDQEENKEYAEENESETDDGEINTNTEINENSSATTESNSDHEDTETPKLDTDSEDINEGDSENDTATEPSEIKEETTLPPERIAVTDKVTVVVVMTPDPNSIESILFNTLPPSERDEEKSSTVNPEYQDYYDNYDANDDEDEEEDEDEDGDGDEDEERKK